MGIDYITGAATAVCGKSPKSESGRLSSKIGWRGLVKKCVTLLLVLVAVRLDLTMGTSYLRDGVCIAFSCNELLSIVENAGLLGVPMPELLRQAIDILQTDSRPPKSRFLLFARLALPDVFIKIYVAVFHLYNICPQVCDKLILP